MPSNPGTTRSPEEAAFWTEQEWEDATIKQRKAALKVLIRDWKGWKDISWGQHSAGHSAWLKERFEWLIAKVRGWALIMTRAADGSLRKLTEAERDEIMGNGAWVDH
jgi:hypothetical protein